MLVIVAGPFSAHLAEKILKSFFLFLKVFGCYEGRLLGGGGCD